MENTYVNQKEITSAATLTMPAVMTAGDSTEGTLVSARVKSYYLSGHFVLPEATGTGNLVGFPPAGTGGGVEFSDGRLPGTGVGFGVHGRDNERLG